METTVRMRRMEQMLDPVLETPAEAWKDGSADAGGTMRPSRALEEVFQLNAEFEQCYQNTFRVENLLTRSLVSFQANKNRAVYRWFKYKEAFSAGLIENQW